MKPQVSEKKFLLKCEEINLLYLSEKLMEKKVFTLKPERKKKIPS